MANINDLFKDDWGYELETWQKDAAEAILVKGCSRNLWKTPRGGRKSTLGDFILASLCIDNPKTFGLIASVGGKQAEEHIRNIKFRVENSPSFFDTLVEPCNAETITFWNGSKIISIPQSSSTRVGYHPDVKYVDELSRITDLFYYTVIKPMGRGKKFIEINSSTPFGRHGAFYSNYVAWKEQMTKGKKYYVADATIKECPWVTEEELDEEREHMPQMMFEQEMLGLFVSPATAVFSSEKIENMQREIYEYSTCASPNRIYSMGVDFGRKRDPTSITITDITQKPFRKVYGDKFKDDWKVQYERIRKAWQMFYPTYCVGDATGVGDPVVQELTDIHMEGYNFGEMSEGNTKKYMLISNLQTLVDRNDILISPMDEELITELTFFEYTDEKMDKMEAAKGHDDDVISIALSLIKVPVFRDFKITIEKRGLGIYDVPNVGSFYGKIGGGTKDIDD